MGSNAIDSRDDQFMVRLMPNSSICFNYVNQDTRLKKSSWMVPHVVKHKENSQVISWRCNWGGTCQADCYYANTGRTAE